MFRNALGDGDRDPEKEVMRGESRTSSNLFGKCSEEHDTI
jgi:hypothetical protein